MAYCLIDGKVEQESRFETYLYNELLWQMKKKAGFDTQIHIYSVTGQPIFIEMIFSWILSVPEFVWMLVRDWSIRDEHSFQKRKEPITNCFETETHHPTSTQIRGRSESTRKSFL